MKVLVAAASKHGATSEIAEAIGQVLTDHGIEAIVSSPDDVEGLESYTAVVLGSAVYAGQWRKEAKEFVTRHRDALIRHDVWLFSSGPLGNPPTPGGEPEDSKAMIALLNPRGHRVFSGKIQRKDLNLAERAMVKAARAPYGDYRDWDEIRRWAGDIADILKAEVAMNTHEAPAL